MKNRFVTFAFFSFCLFTIGSAQSLSPTVIASQGDYYTSPGGTVSFTLGEIITETNTSANHILTKGFQQPILKINMNADNPGAFLTVKFYPNPVTDYLLLDFGGSPFGNYYIQIFDMLGQKLSTDNFTVQPGVNKQLMLSFFNFSSGNYMVNIINQEKNLKQSYKINKVR